MTIPEILDLTLAQFNSRLSDIGTIHVQFNSEKGKPRTKKRKAQDLQAQAIKKGIHPPKFGLVKE